MPADLAELLTMLLSLIGPAPHGEPNIHMPKGLILKPGDQVVAIGDSITEAGGYLKDVDAVLAAQYPGRKLPPIINVGISGQKAEDLVPRFRKDVLDRKPAVVTVSIGINDVWHRAGKPHDPKVLADYWANVARLVDMAQADGVKVILLTPTVIHEDPDSPENKRLRIYVEAEKQVAREKKCTLVDLHRMFLTALAKRPTGADPKTWLTTDGVHMKPPGDALIAIGVLRGLGVPDEMITLKGAKPAENTDAPGPK